jgi:uroporphyrinogen-III synthase
MRLFATRPVHQNALWCSRLERLGVPVVDIPCLEIQALNDDSAYRHKILALDEFSKVIAVSQNAVEHGFNAIEYYWPQLPTGLEWFAVGRKTKSEMAARLMELSGESAEVLLPGPAAMNSEELLASDDLQILNEQKILILRGRGGREYLRDNLLARGASVEYCELYQRVCPTALAENLQNATLQNHDIVTLFSGESLQNFYKTVSNLWPGFRDTDTWASLNWIVPGDRVASLAREMGLKNVIVAKNASEDEVFSVIQRAIAEN